MCGLFGWQLPGTETSDRIALAAVLALMNDERGGDSWGYWSPADDMTPRRGIGPIVKGASAVEMARHSTLIGHTRWRTTGDVTVKNAHPFEHLHVIGAHNGAIFNHYTLDTRYPERDFDVDSQHLIAHIAEDRKTRELEGYGTVIWTDERDRETVLLSRMRQGELAIARVAGGLVWSSDRTHLRSALDLAGMTSPTFLQTKEGPVYTARGGVLQRTQRRIDIRERENVPTKTIFPKSDRGAGDIFRDIRDTTRGRGDGGSWRLKADYDDLAVGFDLMHASEAED